MKSRSLIALVGIASVLFAATGSAAVKPQIVDAKADNIGPAGTDIQSALFTPTLKGKTVTGFRLVLTLDAPASRTPGVLYRVFGEQDNCGTFQISSAATAALITQNQVYMTCGVEASTTGEGTYTIINVSPVADKNTLVWNFKLKDLPKEMRAGKMSGLEAFVTPADPVTGILNTADEDRRLAFDSALGTGTFSY